MCFSTAKHAGQCAKQDNQFTRAAGGAARDDSKGVALTDCTRAALQNDVLRLSK